MMLNAHLHVMLGDDMDVEMKSILGVPLDGGGGLWGYWLLSVCGTTCLPTVLC